MAFEVNFDVLRIDIDVLGQHRHQVTLQGR